MYYKIYVIAPSKVKFMNSKNLLALLLLTSTVTLSAQNRTFAYSNIQTRNAEQQWGEKQAINSQSVTFSPQNINLNIDKNYQLKIISKTNLPDKGVIYLCEDEKANPITVMLFSNIKMYLYSATSRFLINFDGINKG